MFLKKVAWPKILPACEPCNMHEVARLRAKINLRRKQSHRHLGERIIKTPTSKSVWEIRIQAVLFLVSLLALSALDCCLFQTYLYFKLSVLVHAMPAGPQSMSRSFRVACSILGCCRKSKVWQTPPQEFKQRPSSLRHRWPENGVGFDTVSYVFTHVYPLLCFYF